MMDEETQLIVRVTPRASRDEISGWRDGVLLVRLRAPPVDGQANEALRRLLAGRLEIAFGDIEIVRGEWARTKQLRLRGLSPEALRKRLDGGDRLG
jgi:uncharacterized protein (TIGR00251 family)